MPILVPETPIAGRIFVVTEFIPHRGIDQLGEVMRNFDIGTETEKYIAGIA